MPNEPLKKENRWADRISHSVFFVGALLAHLLIFLLVAAWVVIRSPVEPPDPGIVYITLTPLQPPVPKNPDVAKVPTPSLDLPHSTPISPIESKDSNLNIALPPIDLSAIEAETKNHELKLPTPAVHPGPDADRLHEIAANVKRYRHDDPTAPDHDPSKVQATFPVYIASYANGDWACNTRLDKDGNIVAGSIPNLVAKIDEWSKGRIKAEVVPKPLNIAGPELLRDMPPFIFFTGHRDFTLTQPEIENLRGYLQRGGAIWGDNALAGQGSRFDVAFHREMKRVIPDLDKPFQSYSLDDALFTKSRYDIRQVPKGMNYSAELPQHLDIGGTLAILYTPNDYSDMMFMRILPGDQEVYIKNDVPPNTLFTDQSFWRNQTVYYRNFNLQNALAVNRLGMNIITFFLTRFDDMLAKNPSGL